ncbi:MAG: right-handed parallel beta-helix repeat-containing protein, partial [Sphaerochaetaceae bacterium]|nr:right-handed parallel beta-helix repeat-containing protein [Sphaerochaetaceae bacterium]
TLLLILVLSLSLFFSCKSEPYDSHVHKYEKVIYSLSEENKVLKTTICSCGAKNVEIVENAVVVTPETALSVLDSNNSGIIYFSEGEYKEELGIRHSKDASTAIKTSTNEKVDIQALNNETTGNYNYYRTVNNLTLIADENAVFTKDFKVRVGHIYGTADNKPKDPVRDIELVDTNTAFYSYIDIDGIKFYNMKFSEGARLYFHYSSLDCHAKNVEIERCSFTGLESSKEKTQAIKFNADITDESGRMFENLKISNCVIKTYNQGIYTQSLNNVTVSGCDISDVKHNAIAIQASQDKFPFTGSVLIDNNKIKNGSDRAIRFGVGENATIVVSNNTIEKTHDENNEVLKAQPLTNCTHEFVNNTYIGKTMKEVSEPNWIVSFE